MKYLSTIIISIILAGIFAIFSHYVYGLQITEIMFNPVGADTGREWIEITLNESDGCINFTEYKLFEENTNHNIYKYDYNNNLNDSEIACKYIILSNDVNKFLQDYPYLNYSNDSSTSSDVIIYKSSFSLNNDGEYIAVKKDNKIIDEINYTLLIENIDVAEGYSLEYYSDFWRNSVLLKGNPGNILSDENNVSNININNITNIIVNDTADNQTKTINESSNITVDNITDNITENITDISNISYDKECNVSIGILIKNSSIIYENNVPIKFQNKIETDNPATAESGYIIEYWIEDLFGNIVKNKVTTSNQDEKSFTPKIEEADKILVIRNVLRNYSVNNYSCDISNNSGEKIFLVKNSLYVPTTLTKSTTCSACSSKAQTCESSKSSSIYPVGSNSTQNMSPETLIKIINVCNGSQTNTSNDITFMQNSLTQNTYGLSQTKMINAISSNTSSQNSTQNAGKTTSMIVYESPNIKNRIYALIGLILVGLTCVLFVGYKIIMHKTLGTHAESTAEFTAESKR